LNTLIPSGSDLQLTVVDWINDRGEIVGRGHDPSCPNGDSCDAHAYVLIPCDENHSGIAGCDYDAVDATTASVLPPAQITQTPAAGGAAKLSPAEMITRFRSMMSSRYPKRR
jgi:hypothetical protein